MGKNITSAQFERNYNTLRLERFLILLTTVVGIAEAYGWYSFGFNPYMALGFAVWAILIVIMRPKLAAIEVLAIRHRNNQLANSANLLVGLSVVITFVSLFVVYTDAMEHYRKQRISETAAIRIAQASLSKLRDEQKMVLANNQYDNYQLFEAVEKNRTLQQQLSTAQQQAQAKFDNQTKLAQQKLDAFWQKNHRNGLSYSQIITLDGNPKIYRNGTLRSAANDIRPELNTIVQSFPLEPSQDQLVQSIKNQIRQLEPLLILGKRLDGLQQSIHEAEQRLAQQQLDTEVGSEIETYPPAFHQLSKLTGGLVSANSVMLGFGALAIIIVIMAVPTFAKALALAPETVSVERNVTPPSPPQPDSGFFGFLKQRYQKPTAIATTASTLDDNQSYQKNGFGFIPESKPTVNQIGQSSKPYVQSDNHQIGHKKGRKEFNQQNYQLVLDDFQSGLKKAEIVKKWAGQIPRSTVYNYLKGVE